MCSFLEHMIDAAHAAVALGPWSLPLPPVVSATAASASATAK